MALAERHLAARFGDDLVDHSHLGHRRRRLPDGGHQPRGGLARRPSRPGAADRPVRRQRHLDRRADLAVRVRRPGRALRAPTAGSRTRSTATIPQAVERGDRRRAGRDRPAVADRLPDHDRQGRAHQGRQGLGPRRARSAPAEIEGARRSLGWPHAPFEVPDADPGRLARRRRRGAGADDEAWQARLRRPSSAAEFDRAIAGELPADLAATVNAYKRKLSAERPAPATPQGEPDGAARC